MIGRKLFSETYLSGEKLRDVTDAGEQAEITGVAKGFETLWKAELYRSRDFPGPFLLPKEILQIALATCQE